MTHELADHFQLPGDPHDLGPIAVDQVFRLRDALNPGLVNELENFGPLEPDDERFLRQRLAALRPEAIWAGGSCVTSRTSKERFFLRSV